MLHCPYRVQSTELNILNTLLYMSRVSLHIKIKKIVNRKTYSINQQYRKRLI